MLITTLWACLLVAGTVFVHTAGLVWLLKMLGRISAIPPTRFWPITWLLLRLVWLMLLIHLIEIAVWALFYLWRGCLPDVDAAFYFSGVTYATIGYGDIVLPLEWRVLAPIQGLTGILMCGLSTGVFFLVVTRLFADLFRRTSS